VREAVHPVPLTVAAVQLVGAVVAEVESPTCTAVPDGETVPASESAVLAVPVVGGLVIVTLLDEDAATATAALTACMLVVPVCSAQI
jgi:hypothetical protein